MHNVQSGRRQAIVVVAEVLLFSLVIAIVLTAFYSIGSASVL